MLRMPDDTPGRHRQPASHEGDSPRRARETPPSSASRGSLASISHTSLISSKYAHVRMLGAGQFGHAMLVTNVATGEPCVVKRMKSRLLLGPHASEASSLNTSELRESLNEIQALAHLHHSNIVTFHEAWVEKEDSHLHISMEFCPCGDLEHYLATHRTVEEGRMRRWATQLLLALRYMHGHRVIHRDLKLQNIFLADDGATVKIGDFGLSKLLRSTEEGTKTQAGTPYYFSPEVAMGKQHNVKTDVWSLGVVLYYAITRRMPFKSPQGLLGILTAIQTREPTPLRDGAGPLCSPELEALVLAMLTKDAAQRPSASDLLAVPWVAQLAALYEPPPTGAASRGALAPAFASVGDGGGFRGGPNAGASSPLRPAAAAGWQQRQPLSPLGPCERNAAAAAARCHAAPSLSPTRAGAVQAPSPLRRYYDPATGASPGRLGTPQPSAARRGPGGVVPSPLAEQRYRERHAAATAAVAAAAAGVAGRPKVVRLQLLRKVVEHRGARQYLSVNVRASPSYGAAVLAKVGPGDTIGVLEARAVGDDGAPWLRVAEPVHGYCIAALQGQKLFQRVADDGPQRGPGGVSPMHRRPAGGEPPLPPSPARRFVEVRPASPAMAPSPLGRRARAAVTPSPTHPAAPRGGIVTPRFSPSPVRGSPIQDGAWLDDGPSPYDPRRYTS